MFCEHWKNRSMNIMRVLFYNFYIMRSLLLAFLCICMSVSFAFAGESSSSRSEFWDVQHYDFDLSLDIDDGIVKLSWDDFPQNRGFQWYKVMYSTTISDPVYPDQNAVYVGSRRSDTSHKIALKSDNKHYFRICAITMDDDYIKNRYCGKVQSVETDIDDTYDKEEKKEKNYTQRYKDIEYYDYDFKVEVDEKWYANVKWNTYLSVDGFQYYKLLYSTKYANPSYPEISAKHVGDDLYETGKSFKIDTSKEHHYFRLCSIVDEGYWVTARYCSTTKKFTLDDEDERYEDKDDNYEEKQENDEDTNISSDLKDRIDSRLEDFIESLEEKGYSDEDMVKVIDDIIGKLDRYKKIDKYARIASYMQEVLEDYKEDYEDELDIFDDIFGEY